MVRLKELNPEPIRQCTIIKQKGRCSPVEVESLEVEWIAVLDRFNKLNARYKVEGLPRPEFMLLHLIAKSPSGAVKISELATALEVTTPAVSKLLKSLEEKCAVSRVSDITDRRITYITMTKAGRQLYDRALQARRRIGLSVMERIGEQAYKQLFEQMQILYQAFEDALTGQDSDI